MLTLSVTFRGSASVLSNWRRWLVGAVVLVLLVATAVLLQSRASPSRSPSGPFGTGDRGGTSGRAALGVYSDDIQRLNSFQSLVGHPVTHAVAYIDERDWTTLTRPWFFQETDPNLDWRGWATTDVRRRLVISQAMVPKDSPEDWRQRGARGEYDQYWAAFGKSLTDSGLSSVIIRLGWEMNGNWFSGHFIGNSPGDIQDWCQYFRRIVGRLRADSTVPVQIDWNPTARVHNVPFQSYYPGDDVVDIVGLDVYDTSYGRPNVSPEARWRHQFEDPGGLRDVMAFADRHGKPLSIPEWALVAPGDPSGSNGAGDDPTFVEHMAQLIQERHVVYHAYFNVPDDGVGMTLHEAPQALAVFRRKFGSTGGA